MLNTTVSRRCSCWIWRTTVGLDVSTRGGPAFRKNQMATAVPTDATRNPSRNPTTIEPGRQPCVISSSLRWLGLHMDPRLLVLETVVVQQLAVQHERLGQLDRPGLGVELLIVDRHFHFERPEVRPANP